MRALFRFLDYDFLMSKPTKSQEDFLEALLMLEQSEQPLETTRVAKMLSISKPAVHQMGHELINRGWITRKDYGDMKLTDEGRRIAESVLERHHVLKHFLLSLGVGEEIAEHDCCLMEHIVSEETFLAIKKMMEQSQS